MNTKPYDQAFKFLAEQDPESLLLMLGAIEPGEDATIELLPREISVAAVLPDQPYRIISARGERIAHVEAQTFWEPPIPSRMAEYGGLHLYKYACRLTATSSCCGPTVFPGVRRAKVCLVQAARASKRTFTSFACGNYRRGKRWLRNVSRSYRL